MDGETLGWDSEPAVTGDLWRLETLLWLKTLRWTETLWLLGGPWLSQLETQGLLGTLREWNA